MGPTTERAEIEALFQELARAHADHDADAIVRAYAPDAVIFDLAPPLGRHGMRLTVGGNLACVSALSRMRGRQGGEAQDLWYRTTVCLQKTSGRWQIICDHSSVPFYMDGSYRAAVDLTP
jgi:ketosteroid isomerase-like protein